MTGLMLLICHENQLEVSSFLPPGAHPPDLSPQQLELPRCRVSGNLGRALGVVLGCLIGMFPLLFIGQNILTAPCFLPLATYS